MSNVNSNKSLPYCRLCAKQTDNCVYIFNETGVELKLAEKINSCLPFKVAETDDLPKQICAECLQNIESLYCIVENIVDVQTRLKQFIDDNNLEIIEIIDDEIENCRHLCPLCDFGEMITAKNQNEDELLFSNCEDVFSDVNCPQLQEFFSKNINVLSKILEQNLSDSELLNENKIETPATAIISELPTTSIVTPDVSSIYTCRLCSFNCNSIENILYHTYQHVTTDGSYLCTLCTNSYLSKTELNDHFTIQHNSNIVPISGSGTEYVNVTNLLKVNINNNKHHCDVCGITAKNLTTFLNHNCLIKIWGPCPLCLETFKSFDEIEFHTKHHSNLTFCVICKENFDNESLHFHHYKAEHVHQSDLMSTCDLCSCSFGTEELLLLHVKTVHQSNMRNRTVKKELMCRICGKEFRQKFLLKDHLNEHNNQTTESVICYACEECYEAFPTTDHAIAHMNAKHFNEIKDIDNYTFFTRIVKRLNLCEFCDRCFSDLSSLREHKKLSHSFFSIMDNKLIKNCGLYQCKLCLNKFTTVALYRKHLGEYHKCIPKEYEENFQVKSVYVCEYCDKYFLHYYKFREHRTIHNNQYPYHCRLCKTDFEIETAYLEHQKKEHDNYEEVYLCNEEHVVGVSECHFCNRTFKSDDTLSKHVRMHTGEKPYKCDECGKCFSQSSGLYTHHKSHSTQRPYKCHICNRSFKIKGDRDCHVRRHSGTRPYKCEFCGKNFMTQHVYAQHRRIHIGDRRYACDICGMRFNRSYVLTCHRWTHTGEKPYQCSCGKRYRQKSDLTKHKRFAHPPEIAPA